ncbi:hypothetical protein P154DRAFT_532566 [Amniculicola lignicola CBS 123094]|uniref:F-box domain-containing protein n=1 Tax=Amniculicola lignicola CBS 123094 TaxID=1392246 RepID=A0A6A5WZV9_9PLEO|nr:hypothetical protein P154DRAFT_532566 [Amniculicola lignicola CBS 123094]
MYQLEGRKCSSATFSVLPSDVKLDIFDFIQSKVDQGHARLVNKEWSLIMKPRMWREFKTSLQGNITNDIHHLTPEQKSCIQKIRSLVVDVADSRSRLDVRIEKFMDLLQDDQLLEFSCSGEASLSPKHLLILLRHQSNLRTFRAHVHFQSNTFIDDVASRKTGQTSVFKSAFRFLRSLRIYVGDESQKVRQQEVALAELFLEASPLLGCLEICGWRRSWHDKMDKIPLTSVFSVTMGPRQIPRNLKRLVIADMDLSRGGNKLASTVDLSNLHSLKFEYCDNIGSFLYDVGASIRKTGTLLKVLTVRFRRWRKFCYIDPQINAMDWFLASFRGLEDLEVANWDLGIIDWRRGLATHQTLKKFLLSSPSMYFRDSTSWSNFMGYVLEQCPNLHDFACLIQGLDSARLEDMQLPTTLPDFLVAALDLAASVPTLRTLRLLYTPGLEYPTDTERQDPDTMEKTGRIASHMATLALTYLHSKGSNITMLAFSSDSRWKPGRADKNLQYCPHHYYNRRIINIGGEEIIEAVPLREYMTEYPDAAGFV